MLMGTLDSVGVKTPPEYVSFYAEGPLGVYLKNTELIVGAN